VGNGVANGFGELCCWLRIVGASTSGCARRRRRQNQPPSASAPRRSSAPRTPPAIAPAWLLLAALAAPVRSDPAPGALLVGPPVGAGVMDAERAVLCSDADTERTEATEAEDADATDAEDADAMDEELLALAACDAKSCAAVGSKLPATCGPHQARGSHVLSQGAPRCSSAPSRGPPCSAGRCPGRSGRSCCTCP
jgi:hypothetical protein